VDVRGEHLLLLVADASRAARDVGHDDRLAEDDAAEDVADRAVRRAPGPAPCA
jgi:hypothetical protein